MMTSSIDFRDVVLTLPKRKSMVT